MKTERLLKVLSVLRMDPIPSLPDYSAGYNKALEMVAATVTFEDNVMAGYESAERVASFADGAYEGWTEPELRESFGG